MRKLKSESGRSMLEVLAVLVIIGILSIGTLFGYSYLVQRHKRTEAVRQVNEVVVLLNSSDALKHYAAGEKVNLSEVVKGPKIDQGRLMLPTGEDDYAIVTAMEGGQFALALNAQPDVCQAVLNSFSTTKNVVLTVADMDRSTESASEHKGVRSDSPEEFKEAVIASCMGPAGAVFNCSNGSISYGYDYGILCKGCPQNEPYYDGKECCAGPGNKPFCGDSCHCPGGKPNCDYTKGQFGTCVLCTTTGEKGQQGGNEQCWDAYNNEFARHVCKEAINDCVECLEDSDCTSDIGPQNSHTPGGKKNFKYCVKEHCIPCKTNYINGQNLKDGECERNTPLCTKTGCEECPEGTIYDVETQSCVCPEGTIKNPTTGECVKCYDSNKGADTDAGCNTTNPICNEEGTTEMTVRIYEDGSEKTVTRAYKGECIRCVTDANCKKAVPNWYCSVQHACEECPTDKPYFNYDEDVRQCYKCIDDKEAAGLDTGCESGDIGTAKRMCERTSATNAYGDTCYVCQNTKFGDHQSELDDGCTSTTKLCGTNTENGFANECFKCTDDATGANVDSGCSEDTPICAVKDWKNDASKTFGHSCVKCINDKEGAVDVDTGCTTEEPMCVADSGQGGTECTACPPGTIPNPKTKECVYCYDSDTANASTDKGCQNAMPHCDETKTTTVDGKAYKGACFLCNGHYQSGATLPCKSDKPFCHDKKECLTCREISTLNNHNPLRTIWSSEKQGCFVCVDDKANVGTDSGCSNDKRLCSDNAGSNKYATGNTKDGLNGICYQCITDKNCVDLNIGKNYCSNHVCVNCGGDHCIDHNGTCIALSSYIDIKRGNDGRCECYNTLKSEYVKDDGNTCAPKEWDTRKERRTSSRQRIYKVPKKPANFYCTYYFEANGEADDYVVSGQSDGIKSGGSGGTHDSWREAHDNWIEKKRANHTVHGEGKQKQLVVSDRWLCEVGYKGEFLFKIASKPGDTRSSGTKTGISVSKGWNNGGICDNIGGWRRKD
ncbi:MAG: type II secretion system protein [Alphaproteobacteria bacterium]|nr:type II secretion system protein [Alphaproteobacteria bacterium]